jgi:hypothetical protein
MRGKSVDWLGFETNTLISHHYSYAKLLDKKCLITSIWGLYNDSFNCSDHIQIAVFLDDT